MSWALVAVLVVASAVSFVLRLPPPRVGVWLWLGLAVPYAGLALVAVYRVRRLGLMHTLTKFRPGDLSLGFGLGALSVLSAWGLSRLLLPLDAAGHAWLLRIFLLVGDGSSREVTLCLLVIAACEEWVWRGWVQSELALRLGVRRGWVVAALCHAAAYVPTLVTLADDVAGPNPLIVLCALGCGLCWGFLRERTGRTMPGVFAHLVFTYLAAQYLGRFV